MFHVLKQEFIDSFKSVRSILIILFITFISYQSATFIDHNLSIFNEMIGGDGDENSLYTAVIALIVVLFGFLFVFATSHNLINKEIELGTMRLLVTKISRVQIMAGKLLGTFLFWVVTISISFAIMSIIAGAWFPKDYLQSVVFLFYMISFVLLISTVVSKSTLTMFLGIILGITLPIIGMVTTVTDKWYLVPFKYILPYNYLDGSVVLMFVPLGIGVVYFLIAVYFIKRRDL